MAIKSEFVIESRGKKAVLYAGLLAEAHDQGLSKVDTMLLQIPSEENGFVAVARAEVVTSKGTFVDYGDACPQNVAKHLQGCIVRMAITRAKARAFRDALNIGMVALEELDDEDQSSHGSVSSTESALSQNGSQASQGGAGQAKPIRTEQRASSQNRPSQQLNESKSEDAITPAQVGLIQNLLPKTNIDVEGDLSHYTRQQASELITRLRAATR